MEHAHALAERAYVVLGHNLCDHAKFDVLALCTLRSVNEHCDHQSKAAIVRPVLLPKFTSQLTVGP